MADPEMTNGPHLVIYFFLDPVESLGRVRNKASFHIYPHKQSIVLQKKLSVMRYVYITSWQAWAFHKINLQFRTVIIKEFSLS